jgi:hypothetical protein
MKNKTETADEKARTRWLNQEKQRRIEVRQLFEMHTRNGGEAITDLMNECLDDPAMTAERSSKLLLTELGKMNADPLGGDYRQLSNGGALSQRDMQQAGSRYGEFTARDTLGELEAAATDAILMRGGITVEKPHPAAADCSRMRMSDFAETYARQYGARTSGMSRDQIVRKALSTRGLISHSTSDFSSLLENVASKALLKGFFEVRAIHRKIAKIGSLPDFKEGSRTALSDFSDLDVVFENGEYKFGTFSDLKETLQLSTYGKLFSISRQALVNDDLNAFVNVPRGMASAASRVIDDLVVGVLTANAALNQDSTALFHADHSNLVAPGSGAAPSVSTLDAGFQAMALQQGPGGATLDIVPSILLVPVALDATARTLTSAINDPSGATFMEPNPFVNRLEVVSTARLDADDPLQWYLMADPNMFDTLEVAFLDGQSSPFLESKDGWSTDGIEYKVRIDAAATATDFRGLYQNDGN